jgi:exodeoxyribonuclease VII large subunit
LQSYSLFELNQFIRRVLALNLAEPVWIQCEIAQCNLSRGHYWIELIEKGGEQNREVLAQASAVIWSRQVARLRKNLGPLFQDLLQEGRSVKLQVQVDFSERFGLKLIIQDIDPAYTLGQLALQKKAILERLKAEQLLGKNRSVAVATVIQKVAVISSDTAAGYQDFVQQLEHNAYGYAYKLDFYASAMQGASVEKEMLAQLKKIRFKAQQYDAVVIIRGGGARLDLSAFDNYALGEAIAQFPLPVMIGIGHDVDETILDLVASQSLKTPTAVADFLLHHNERFEYSLQQIALHIQQHTFIKLREQSLLVEQLNQRIENGAFRQINLEQAALNLLQNKLKLLAQRPIQAAQQVLQNFETQIEILDPQVILRRGYALIQHENGQVVRSAEEVNPSETIKIQFHDGQVDATINQKNHE